VRDPELAQPHRRGVGLSFDEQESPLVAERSLQLRGEWFHRGARTGARVFGPGSVHVISPSEQYDLTCCATRHETGLQVGFIVYPDEIANFAPTDQDVVFAQGATLDRRLAELCRAYVDAADHGAQLPHAQVRSEVLRWVAANVEATPSDPVVSAKRFLDRTFASPLYLQHLADAAGMK
jgi:hypothetical protein